MKAWIFLLVLPLILPGCHKPTLDLEQGKTMVLFQEAFVNAAWGYHHNGWIIDTSGNVKAFKQPAAWNFPDSSGYLTNLQMEQNLDMLLPKVLLKIEKKDMQTNYGKAFIAEKGVISTPKNQMFDAGVTIYSVIIYHPQTKKWKETLLFQRGDWETKNESSEANELYNWLLSIQQNIAPNL
jgi:hypothetical protein